MAEFNDCIFQRQRALLVRIRARYAVSAVYLCFNERFVNVNIRFDIGDRLFMIALRKVVGFQECALQCGVGVRICLDRRSGRDLTAARLIFQRLFMCAVINDLVAL